MWKFILKYGPAILLAVGPLFTYQFSLLDLLGYHPGSDGLMHVAVWSRFAFDGAKPEVEMKVRAFVTFVGVTLLVASGYFDAYRPSRTLESFRSDYLDTIAKDEWRKKSRIPKTVRINVMYLRWQFLPIPRGRIFEMIWKDGFEPKDRDGDLRLCSWQGVCGQAARRREAVCVDFRDAASEAIGFWEKWAFRNKFHLSAWQLSKTKGLTAILSVPMIERYGKKGQEKYDCVGVINLDTSTADGAEYLTSQTKDLTLMFARHGTLIAKLR